MRLVSTEHLRPGMLLGCPIYADGGEVLLQRGVTLTERYITSIAQRGFASAYIADSKQDDAFPHELVSDQVRREARKHTKDIVDAIKPLSASAKKRSPQAQLEAVTSVAKSIIPLVNQLCDQSEKLLEDILMSPDALDGIGSLKSYDNYTFEHSVEVAVVSALLGRRLFLPQDKMRQLVLGALLHDIGKLTIPVEIVNKPSELTEEEMSIIRGHPNTGFELIRRAFNNTNLLAQHVILQHHERQDGRGYPRQLKGHNSVVQHQWQPYEIGRITLVAEIAAVADVYAALSSDRPYRRALEHYEIIEQLKMMSGHHLSSDIINTLIAMLPLYPIGSQVIFLGGSSIGCRGIVVDNHKLRRDKPVVRVELNARREKVEPYDVDLDKEPSATLAIIKKTELARNAPAITDRTAIAARI